MSTSNYLETSFNVMPVQAVTNWLDQQLDIVQKIASKSSSDASLFGIGKATISRVVPEAADLSGYINVGMSGMRPATLAGPMANSVLYKSSKVGTIRQFPDGHFYVSGVPGGRVEVMAPRQLGLIPIIRLKFTKNTLTNSWIVSTHQKYPRLPCP